MPRCDLSKLSDNHVIATLLIVYPLLLSIARMLAALLYMVWGQVPASGYWIASLIFVFGSIVLDGRLKRCLRGLPTVGGVLDTVADHIVACLLILKMSIALDLTWLMCVLFAQYGLAACARLVFVMRFHHLPVPDIASYAASSVYLGVAVWCAIESTASSWVILAAGAVGANQVHVTATWLAAFKFPEAS